MSPVGCILCARTVEMHGCSILSHDRQQGSVRQKTHNPELVKMHRNGDHPSARAHSARALPLLSPFTVAPSLAHRPLQQQLPVNVWGDNSTRQVKRTGGSEEEVMRRRSRTHVNSGSLSSDSEARRVLGRECSGRGAPGGGDIVPIMR